MNTEARLVFFSGFEGFNPLKILSMLPDGIRADAEMERSRAQMEAAKQPSKVAEIYSKAQREIQEAQNRLDGMKMAVNLLYAIHFGDQSGKKETRETIQTREMRGEPEPILHDLLTTLTLEAITDQLQHGMGAFAGEGSARGVQAYSGVQQILETMVEGRILQAREMNAQYPLSRLPIPAFQKASFGLNDHLIIVLNHVDPSVMTDLSAIENPMQTKNGSLLLRRQDNGLMFQKINPRDVRISPVSFPRNATASEAMAIAENSASRSQEISDLSRQILSAMMELQTLRGSEPQKPEKRFIAAHSDGSGRMEAPDYAAWEKHMSLENEVKSRISHLIETRKELMDDPTGEKRVQKERRKEWWETDGRYVGSDYHDSESMMRAKSTLLLAVKETVSGPKRLGTVTLRDDTGREARDVDSFRNGQICETIDLRKLSPEKKKSVLADVKQFADRCGGSFAEVAEDKIEVRNLSIKHATGIARYIAGNDLMEILRGSRW